MIESLLARTNPARTVLVRTLLAGAVGLGAVSLLTPSATAAVQSGTDGSDRPAAQRLSFGPGTFRIGHDIGAGIYRANKVGHCHWERRSRHGHRLASGHAGPGHHVVVIIKSTDGTFWSRGCGVWTRVK